MAKTTSSVPAKSAAPTKGAPRPGANQSVKPDFGAELDAMIASTPEAAEFGEIPDGAYVIRIDSATFNHSKASGRKQLSWQLGIVDGDFKGRKLFKHDGMETPDQLSWIRGSLGRLGHEWPPTFAELQAVVTSLVGTYATITAKTKSGSDIQNIYFNEAVDPAAVGTSGLEEAPSDEDAGDETEVEAEVVQATAAPKPAKPTAAPATKPAATTTAKAAPAPSKAAPALAKAAPAAVYAVGTEVNITFEDGPQHGVVKSLGKGGAMVVTLDKDGDFQCKVTDEFVSLYEATESEPEAEPEVADDQAIAEEGGLVLGFAKLNPLELKKLNEAASKAGFSAGDYADPMDLLRDLCEYNSVTGNYAKAIDLIKALG